MAPSLKHNCILIFSQNIDLSWVDYTMLLNFSWFISKSTSSRVFLLTLRFKILEKCELQPISNSVERLIFELKPSSSGHIWMQSWTVKKAEHWRIDAFKLWCWRRLLRGPWTARRSKQSILKEISPGCFLEGMMLKLKLQYFGHLMGRVASLEKTLMIRGIEDRRKRKKAQWLRVPDFVSDECIIARYETLRKHFYFFKPQFLLL